MKSFAIDNGKLSYMYKLKTVKVSAWQMMRNLTKQSICCLFRIIDLLWYERQDERTAISLV